MATQMGKGEGLSRFPIERSLIVVYDDVWWALGSLGVHTWAAFMSRPCYLAELHIAA